MTGHESNFDMDEHLRQLVASAPPLTEEQRRKLAGIFATRQQQVTARKERRVVERTPSGKPVTHGANAYCAHGCRL